MRVCTCSYVLLCMRIMGDGRWKGGRCFIYLFYFSAVHARGPRGNGRWKGGRYCRRPPLQSWYVIIIIIIMIIMIIMIMIIMIIIIKLIRGPRGKWSLERRPIRPTSSRTVLVYRYLYTYHYNGICVSIYIQGVAGNVYARTVLVYIYRCSVYL